MAYFHLKLRAPRPTFPFDMTETEGAAMAAHSAYWQDLAARGIAIVVGPVFDPGGSFGLAIIEAENEAQAEYLGAADPIIKSALGFQYEYASMPQVILRESRD